MKRTVVLPFLFLTLLLSSCALFVPPHTLPNSEFLQKTSGEVGLFATGADRRVFVVSERALELDKFCAEPPPDVASNVIETLASALELELETGEASGGIDGRTAQTLTNIINELFTPTQGNQLFRIGLYNLCQAKVNGDINQEEYIAQYRELLSTSAKLIELELQLRPELETAQESQTTLAQELQNFQGYIEQLQSLLNIEGLRSPEEGETPTTLPDENETPPVVPDEGESSPAVPEEGDRAPDEADSATAAPDEGKTPPSGPEEGE